MKKKLQIEVASDVVCPWCYIGKRRLDKAIDLLKDEYEVEVQWLPFQLNPGLPSEGMPRADYRKAKFGSLERSKQMDARVSEEGKGEGIEFAFERMQSQPNTTQAHRLIALAENQDAVVDALFKAHFEQGRNIGDPQVLAEIAAQCGVQGWPERAHDVSKLEEEVRELGISAVPTFIFERRTGVSGAYPAETLARAIREASSK